jgi:hypothetical protein
VKRLHESHKVALLETLGRSLKALRRLPDVSQGTLHPQVPKLCPIEGEDLHGQLLEAPDLPYRNESLYHHPGLAVEGAHNTFWQAVHLGRAARGKGDRNVGRARAPSGKQGTLA